MKFGSAADLQNCLTRSATRVVPTAAAAATFQGAMGRSPSGQETD